MSKKRHEIYYVPHIVHYFPTLILTEEGMSVGNEPNVTSFIDLHSPQCEMASDRK
jgi:hypothetical protein